ncbi:serine hydrolase domain-containing protein [Streptomyces sp. NBC_01092]|uniref:serine hydrolase domain-containing protein n=1 Tax=Streptomyces sp. NBC_01092 TaxID=2903748 RepID=UPI00386E84A8|nr:beta-lactamase family protein [Streptomyces sp. NBC_01092]
MKAHEAHPVHGWTDSGYEGVRAAFADVIDAQPETPGQQLAVYRNGRLVVDLWAGPEVDGDSLFGVYSVSKGAVFMVVALLVQDGSLDLDREVAAYWPEFGQAGKADITLRQLLAHQAGVIGVDEHFTVEELADDRVLAERLAAQKPYWKPGTAFGYHGLVIGALVGEVVHRATGRTLHDWWEHRVRRPHGLSFHLGLPQELEPRYRPMRPAAPEPGQITPPEDPPEGQDLGAIAFSTRHLPDLATFSNVRRVRELGQGSAGGVASARGAAGAYAALLGGLDGTPPLFTADTVATFTRPHSVGPDVVTKAESRFTLGFQLYDVRSPALGSQAFGHAGAAGSAAFASPGLGIAYAYVRGQFAVGDAADRENTLLINEVLAAG